MAARADQPTATIVEARLVDAGATAKPGIHPMNVDENTQVILLGDKAGKLSDLKVGASIKVYWDPDPNDPKQQRIVKIEPSMPWWAAQRLASAILPEYAPDLQAVILPNDAPGFHDRCTVGLAAEKGVQRPSVVV